MKIPHLAAGCFQMKDGKPFSGVFVEVNRYSKVYRVVLGGTYHNLNGPSYFELYEGGAHTSLFDINGSEVGTKKFADQYMVTHLKEWDGHACYANLISLLSSVNESVILSSYDDE